MEMVKSEVIFLNKLSGRSDVVSLEIIKGLLVSDIIELHALSVSFPNLKCI